MRSRVSYRAISMEPSKSSIRKDDLRKKLVRAAQVRSVVTMLSVVLSLLLAGELFGESIRVSPVPLIVIFGGPALVGWLMTVFYCQRTVLCPRCGQSLWNCGTGNFKPRRMKVREDVVECPSCRSPIL